MPAEPYLKHVTIVVVAVCATLLAHGDAGLSNGALVLLGTIAGYALKNGATTLRTGLS